MKYNQKKANRQFNVKETNNPNNSQEFIIPSIYNQQNKGKSWIETQIRHSDKLNSSEYRVLAELCALIDISYSRSKINYCYPSYEHIARNVNLGKRQVINIINNLIKKGFIKKSPIKNNTNNFYLLSTNFTTLKIVTKPSTEEKTPKKNTNRGETDCTTGGETDCTQSKHIYKTTTNKFEDKETSKKLGLVSSFFIKTRERYGDQDQYNDKLDKLIDYIYWNNHIKAKNIIVNPKYFIEGYLKSKFSIDYSQYELETTKKDVKTPVYKSRQMDMIRRNNPEQFEIMKNEIDDLVKSGIEEQEATIQILNKY